MNHRRGRKVGGVVLTAAFAFLLSFLPGAAAPDPSRVLDIRKTLSLTRTAFILAGMKDEAARTGATLPKSEAWRDYRLQLNRNWERWKARHLAALRSWADEELPAARARASVVYYPFSGPDILYAYVLFPHAETYILTGLEPPGEVVPRDEYQDALFEPAVEDLKRQLQDILGLTFFRRNDLKEAPEGLGIGNVLLVFLARMGCEVLDASSVYLNRRSQAVPLPPGAAGTIDAQLVRGLRILFRHPPEPGPQTIYYFSTDLSDEGMKKHPEYLGFLANWPRPVTFLKAATYLLQHKTFSRIRGEILDRSSAVLQDDSGLALAKFASGPWAMTFYGHYVGPIDLFADFLQDDLKKAYASDAVKPLPFGIGYRFRPNESCLMLAERKADPPVPPPAALRSVTVDGVESPNAIILGDRATITLAFSGPVNPDTVLAYVKSRTGPLLVSLELGWDRDRRRAAGALKAPLPRGAYTVVLGAGAEDANGRPVGIPDVWPLRVLGLSSRDFEAKTILVDRETQQVLLCGKDGRVRTVYQCATGVYYPTAGTFRVFEKIPSARSLFDDSTLSYFTVFQKSETGYNVGFHAVPVFPDNRPVEGLGRPVSHGCVRLAPGAARDLYDWAAVGTKVIVN